MHCVGFDSTARAHGWVAVKELNQITIIQKPWYLVCIHIVVTLIQVPQQPRRRACAGDQLEVQALALELQFLQGEVRPRGSNVDPFFGYVLLLHYTNRL